jgi:serine/threonine protein kinase
MEIGQGLAARGIGHRKIRMTAERWQQVKAIFDRAVECSPNSRGALIRELCGDNHELQQQVESLLASDEADNSVLDGPLLSEAAVNAATTVPGLRAGADPFIGRNVGPYRVIREIGRGGMGCVYLAQRDDQFRRRVALKAVDPKLVDLQTLHRFENERQTLATLDHPNIIKLIDGGATEDGIPWLVMDYVEGETIDKYCELHKPRLADRLNIFRTVCAAVHYAHQNLVIHRDLKPGNILITAAGVPKLLDFGIAKLLRPEFMPHTVGHTRTGLRPMTPQFASPEQIRGLAVTTASDIYSLGVLLYFLITGKQPHTGASLLDLQRAVCETEPEKPSAVVKAQHGEENISQDLDNIVLKAMRKEPQRRYASAEHLSEDIRRYLDGQPVTARKDTLLYRVSKFVNRNRVGVAAASLAAVALISTTAFAWHEAIAAERQRRDAEQQRSIAESKAAEADREREKAERRLADLQKLADGVVRAYTANGNGAADSSALMAENVRDSLLMLGKERKLEPGLEDVLDKTAATVQSRLLANDPSWQVPDGWTANETRPREYRVGLDHRMVRDGKPSLFLRSLAARPAGQIIVFQRFDARNYRGKRIRLSAFLRSEAAMQRAVLGLNVSGQVNRAEVSGTTGWKRRELVSDVPASADWIQLLVTLEGAGTVWANELNFEEVSASK